MTPERWEAYMYGLIDLSPGSAKKHFRQSIKDEWGCCAYCGRVPDKDDRSSEMTLDHVKPRFFGGSSLRSNLVPACTRCNKDKGSIRYWKHWYEEQVFYCPAKAARIETWLQPESIGGNNGRGFHYRTTVRPQKAQDRDEGALASRVNGSIIRVLGGSVSAEAVLFAA
jgi:hypothetical protein